MRLDPHDIDACYEDGEGTWTLVCACSWECWGIEGRTAAEDVWIDHVSEEARNQARARIAQLAHARELRAPTGGSDGD